MEHTRPHPLAGQQAFLRLHANGPRTGVLYTGLLVKVLDWADRQTGQPWAELLRQPGESRSYLTRVGNKYRDDADVVAVTPEGHRAQQIFLVHKDEIGTVKE